MTTTTTMSRVALAVGEPLLEIDDPRSRLFNLRVIASGDGSGRVVYYSIAHQILPDVVVRRATEDDSETLRTIERRRLWNTTA